MWVTEQKKDSNLLAGYTMRVGVVVEFLPVDFQGVALQEK